MPITTLDQAAAGAKPPGFFAKSSTVALVAGRPYNPWYLVGVPSAASVPAPGLTGAALTSYAGQQPIPAASANTHLHRMSGVSAQQGGVLLLCDRLWHNSGIVVTTATNQTINSVAWPARDANGATAGEQVFIGLEVTNTTGAGAAAPTLFYTNQLGTTGRQSGLLDGYAASSATGMFFRFGLNNGTNDTGVQSIQSITLGTSMTSGSISLVAYRVLAALELLGPSIPNGVDFLTSGGPRCYDTTVPFLLYIPQNTSVTQLTGIIQFTQG